MKKHFLAVLILLLVSSGYSFAQYKFSLGFSLGFSKPLGKSASEITSSSDAVTLAAFSGSFIPIAVQGYMMQTSHFLNFGYILAPGASTTASFSDGTTVFNGKVSTTLHQLFFGGAGFLANKNSMLRPYIGGDIGLAISAINAYISDGTQSVDVTFSGASFLVKPKIGMKISLSKNSFLDMQANFAFITGGDQSLPA